MPLSRGRQILKFRRNSKNPAKFADLASDPDFQLAKFYIDSIIKRKKACNNGFFIFCFVCHTNTRLYTQCYEKQEKKSCSASGQNSSLENLKNDILGLRRLAEISDRKMGTQWSLSL